MNLNSALPNRRHPPPMAYKHRTQRPLGHNQASWAITKNQHQFIMTNQLVGKTNRRRHTYRFRLYLTQKFKLIGRNSTSYLCTLFFYSIIRCETIQITHDSTQKLPCASDTNHSIPSHSSCSSASEMDDI